jgi:CTP synthase (UTP-ammonia lyase)
LESFDDVLPDQDLTHHPAGLNDIRRDVPVRFPNTPALSRWRGVRNVSTTKYQKRGFMHIGIIGDFQPSYPSHLATNEALEHSARALSLDLDYAWLPTGSLEDIAANAVRLRQYDGLWCAPGSPYNSMTGALEAIRFAREHNVPFVGT